MSEARAARATGDEDLLGLLRGVRQVRHFRSDPVPAAALDEILEVARWTGSSANRQPWEFVVVRSADTLGELAALAPNADHLGRAPMAIVVVMPGGQVALDAFDEGRVTERIVSAAAALGLGAGIGWIMADQRDAARELLDIPPDRLVRTAIAIGYRAGGGRRAIGRRRRPRSELVHEEHW